MRIEVVDLPDTFEHYGRIRLAWQNRVRPPEHQFSETNTWEIEVPIKDGKWGGPSVGRNPDGRRFLYFAWVGASGERFRRIKLYQDQVQGSWARLSGRMKDGTPACSTAIVLETG